MNSFCFSKTQQEEYQNDALYSEEYFDYLIECASLEAQEKAEAQKAIEKEKAKKNKNLKNLSEITQDEIDETDSEAQDSTSEVYEPFKLRIESKEIGSYSEAFKKEDSKTIIPITSKFSLTQDTLKFKNKYNSNDYRILAGGEYQFNKHFNVASGLETNYRSLDQTPISKKIYITPTLKLSNKFSISFYNKMDTQTKSSDHDVSLNFSPFKSNKFDLKIYAGLTRAQSGTTSESVSFYTNFYF